MLRLFLYLGLFAGLILDPTRAVRADDKEAWHEAETKKLRGWWTTSRERKIDKDKVRRSQLSLEFTDGKVTLLLTEEGAKGKGSEFQLTVVRLEQAEGARRLVLSAGKGEGGSSVVYYAFQDDKLILVGNCPLRRPFEGASLSGEYKRTEKGK
jgi:hypothetical protein